MGVAISSSAKCCLTEIDNIFIKLRNWKNFQFVSSFFNEDITATQKLKTYKSSPLKALVNHM